jgi:hypothetical protein
MAVCTKTSKIMVAVVDASASWQDCAAMVMIGLPVCIIHGEQACHSAFGAQPPPRRRSHTDNGLAPFRSALVVQYLNSNTAFISVMRIMINLNKDQVGSLSLQFVHTCAIRLFAMCHSPIASATAHPRKLQLCAACLLLVCCWLVHPNGLLFWLFFSLQNLLVLYKW